MERWKKDWVGEFVITGLMLVWFGVTQAEAAVLINEVLADPSALSGDANGDGLISTTQDEFVELANPTGLEVFLDDWTVSDLTGVRHQFSSTAVIPPWGFFVVFGGGSPQGFSNFAVASTGGLGLNNSGDTVSLKDSEDILIDSFIYGSEASHDVSLTRSPDATGLFVRHSLISQSDFSPGATIDGKTSLPSPEATSPIPEPSSLAFLGMGMGLLGIKRPARGKKR